MWSHVHVHMHSRARFHTSTHCTGLLLTAHSLTLFFPSRLRPKGAYAEGIYETRCNVCGTQMKFRSVVGSSSNSSGGAKCGSKHAAKGGASCTVGQLRVSVPSPGVKDITSISFTLNGNAVTVDNPSPTMSLNEYLRVQARLKVCALALLVCVCMYVCVCVCVCVCAIVIYEMHNVRITTTV